MNFVKLLKNIWNFLWYSNSIWSYILDILIIFLIVKFIVFPLIGLLLGTPVPLVIVESGSMQHEGDFDSWWNLHGYWYLERNISKEEVYSWNFRNGMNKGDIIVVIGNKNKEFNVGDVIVFSVQQNKVPIIHRIVGIKNIENNKIYETKGDHNDGQHIYEKNIKKEQILGKAVFRIPKMGWIKLFFVELFRIS